MNNLMLPEGYRFSPRDYEFISYLRRRKNGEPQPFGHQFVEIDLYSLKHPSQLFEGTYEKELFFFTTLKKLKPSSRRVIRVAGDGTWKSQHSDPIADPYGCYSRNGLAIGENTSLKFEANQAAAASSSSSSSRDGFRYIMHEYSLPKSEDYLGVACVIKKEPPLKGYSSSYHAEEEHQEVLIPQQGQKRPRDDQEYGGHEEECSTGPNSKNMRLHESQSEDLDEYSKWLDDVLIEEGAETNINGVDLDSFLRELQSVVPDGSSDSLMQTATDLVDYSKDLFQEEEGAETNNDGGAYLESLLRELQSVVLPEGSESLMQTTTDPVDYCKDLAVLI